MTDINVEITAAQIQKASKGSATDALLQVIANAVDADATEVRIRLNYENEGIDNEEMNIPTLSKIVICDNGYGIDSDKVNSFFSQYGKSWKENQLRQNGRGYNGKNGTGRFKYLTLGNTISWRTTHEKGASHISYSMTLKYDTPKSIPITNKRESTDPIGTEVVISDISEKGSKLTENEVITAVLQGFGLYIKNSLGNFKVYLNEIEIDPEKYIDQSQSGTFNLNIDDESYVFRYEFIAWEKNFEFKNHKHTFLYDQDENYKGLVASGVNASTHLPFHTVLIFSDYYNKFDSTSGCFSFVSDQVRNAYRTQLTKFLFKVKKSRSKKEYESFRQRDFYPFDTEQTDKISKAEQEIFDLCAYSILDNDPKLLSNKKHSLSLLFKLLKKVVEKDEHIADNLSEILDLDDKHASMLKSACKSTKLPQLITHYNELQRRETFLDILNTLVHEEFYKEHLKERTQLHKILEKELWVFGEEFDYKLGNSDQALTSVLEKHLQANELDDEFIKDLLQKIKQDAKNTNKLLKKIPDIYMWRAYRDNRSTNVKNLVIELKAPKVSLGIKERDQADKIYRAIAKAKGSGYTVSDNNKWEYYLISSKTTDELDICYADKSKGILYQYDNYTIYAVTWEQVIKSARFKLEEVKKGLEIEISEEQKQDLLSKYLDSVGFEVEK